jgi:hypothetical protein
MANFPSLQSQAQRIELVTVQIPASGGNAANLRDLVVAALNARNPGLGDAERPRIMGGRINKASAAYVAGTAAATGSDFPVSIGVGEAYEEPCVNFLEATFVKSAGTAFNAVVSVYLSRR